MILDMRPHARRARRRAVRGLGSNQPRVSVVIPCYNYGAFLQACVRSALDQDDVHVDVTIVDDASTDDSASIARALAAAETRVRVVRHETNLGHLATANEALSHAEGEYVVKLDADDLLTPGSLARSAALLRRHPELSFVYGWAESFQGSPPQIATGEARSWTIWPGEDWVDRVLRRAHNVIAQPEVMIRRSALLAVGGYRLDLPWAEDYNLWLRLASSGAVGRVNGCTQGLYRIHPHSFQRSHQDVHLSDLRGRVAATRRYLEEEGGARPERASLALASLARDTRRLLATRREQTETPTAVLIEYADVAAQLEAEAGIRRTRGPLVWDGALGRQARRGFEAFRWRRWRATGV